MGRIVKCYYCNKTGDNGNTEEIMQLPNKRYAHIKCYEFTQKEKKEKDDLVEAIKEVCNILTIPSYFFPFIEDLRNGTNRCQNSSVKKKKKGYRYALIRKTYELNKKTIQSGIRKNKIEDNRQKLMYAYAIVVNKIDRVNDYLKQQYRLKMSMKEKEISVIEDTDVVMDTNVTPQKKYSWLEEED